MTMNPRRPIKTSTRIARAVDMKILSWRDIAFLAAGVLIKWLVG